MHLRVAHEYVYDTASMGALCRLIITTLLVKPSYRIVCMLRFGDAGPVSVSACACSEDTRYMYETRLYIYGIIAYAYACADVCALSK
jgi:hypothetical protein